MRTLIALMLCLLSAGSWASHSGALRLALNDLPGKGMLPILVAVEHAREKGVAIELSYLNSENIVIQAVNAGLADIGMGTPYQYVQESGSPIRMIYQLNRLAFHPVVNTDHFQSWKDLDGHDMYAHGAGSGTEAIVNILAKRNGIQYGKIHYLPGSGTRARAMIDGRIKATVLDAERTRLLLDHPSGRFARLPLDGVTATDEALFALPSVLSERGDEVKVLLRALLDVWGRMNRDPAWLSKERKRLGLLQSLTPKDAASIEPYIREMVAGGAFASDGGARGAVAEDFSFYTAAGTLMGEPSRLSEADFWELRLLRSLAQ